MASKLQTKAAQVSQFVTKNGSSYYKELMERNNQYIQKPSSAHTCQLLAKQLFYTRLASIPRRYEALWKELDSLKQFLKTKDAWSMENASVAALFGVECYAWSWGGEIIGRGFTLTGYYV
ncbi:Mitochondrial ATP synthase subunit G protein isoform 2 [Theobroma cacao]|uniref:Mitochondrial ATP synthase subunit G protein isoform 2 n=1 Tax=Theobroma cacao TaxID=3641 RepID=A0A061GCB0_THECC|nr:Mitochondrial ATP synthase subunit G protein isoform 2 [Theobroma cacao]